MKEALWKESILFEKQKYIYIYLYSCIKGEYRCWWWKLESTEREHGYNDNRLGKPSDKVRIHLSFFQSRHCLCSRKLFILRMWELLLKRAFIPLTYWSGLLQMGLYPILSKQNLLNYVIRSGGLLMPWKERLNYQDGFIIQFFQLPFIIEIVRAGFCIFYNLPMQSGILFYFFWAYVCFLIKRTEWMAKRCGTYLIKRWMSTSQENSFWFLACTFGKEKESEKMYYAH